MIPLDFEYFKQPVSPYYLHEDLIVTIELNKPEKLCYASDDDCSNLQSQILRWNTIQLLILGIQEKSL